YNGIINALNKNTLNQCIIFLRFIVFKSSILEHLYYFVKTLYLNYISVNLYIYNNLIKLLLVKLN
ncbi:hypothetical protein, partial [Plasmodium yoelii yoelii]